MNQVNIPLGIILGPKSSGKSKILNNLQQFSNKHPLSENIYIGNKLALFNFKGLLLDESNIQQSYMKLSELFQLGFKSLKRIFVVVKYDRIENMKAIMKPIFVKIRHYIDFTTLIISSLELSTDQTQDEYLLKTDLLKYFDITSVIYCQQHKDISPEIIYQSSITYFPFDLDIRKLRLLPQGIDQQQLIQMQRIFNNQSTDHLGHSQVSSSKMTQSCYIESDQRVQQEFKPQINKNQHNNDQKESFPSGNTQSSQSNTSISNQQQIVKHYAHNYQKIDQQYVKLNEGRDLRTEKQLYGQDQERFNQSNDNQITTTNKQEAVKQKATSYCGLC